MREQVRYVYAVEIEMVMVSSGPFKRGLPDGLGEEGSSPALRAIEMDSSWIIDESETPAMAVEMAPFWIGLTEITNVQYL